MSVAQNIGTPARPMLETMSLQDRFADAIRRSQKYMPAEAWSYVKGLLDPESLALIVSVTGLWALSHFFGVGEIADGVLLVAGTLTLGVSAVDVGRDLLAFGNGVRGAKTTDDLEEAARRFAHAVVLGGITIVTAMFFKTRPKVFNEPVFPSVRVPSPGPRGPGLFYKPQIKVAPIANPDPLFTTMGITDMFGDITIEAKLTTAKQLEVLWHERVHQILTPRLYFLRNIRIKVAIEGYNRSYLLRYLEEALAESYAQLRARGVPGLISGIKFPVKNGYVTIGSMVRETRGILLGSVLVGATSYSVIYSPRP